MSSSFSIKSWFGSLVLTLFVLVTALLLPSIAEARIGVGVGTGKIQLEEDLYPGMLYELPSITVINTGDQAGEYELDVTYHEQQPEIRPDKAWFTYTPSNFSLEPGEAKEVKIKLALPVKTEPGDYFAYLEARPKATVQGDGGTSIGVAAASKLNFTVAPANIWQGMWFKLKSWWQAFTPFPQIVLGTIFFLVVMKLLSSKLSLSVSVKPKANSSKDHDSKKSSAEPESDHHDHK